MQSRPLIGVVAPILSKFHLTNTIRGIVSQADACGCDVMILSPLCSFHICSTVQSGTEQEIYDLIRSEAFSGFIYIKDHPNMGDAVIERIEALLRESNRYVMAVDEADNPLFDSTQYDDYYDFGKVVEHLVQVHGYRKIYCLTGPEELFQSQTRLRAYMDILHKYDLYYDTSYYFYGTFWVDSSQKLANRLISGELSMPDAIACGNDIMAMSLIKCLQGAGIRVPEDVAVTGYDGFPFSANIDVTLTTYARNHFQLGADAMRRLMRNLTGKLYEKVSRPDNGFILGSSCGCKYVPAHQLRNGMTGNKPAMWKEASFCDDLHYDLSMAEDTEDLLRRVLRHTDTLYNASRLGIYLSDGDAVCLRAEYADGSCAVLHGGETFGKSDVLHFLPRDRAERSAVFISPLHYGNEQYGYLTLEFHDRSFVYDGYYLNFASAQNVNLHRLLSCTPRRQNGQESGIASRKSTERRNSFCRLRSRLQSEPERYPSIDRICEEMHMSRSTLQKNYREFFNTTIFEDLIVFRVEKAQQLLSGTNTPVGQIASMCGYSSESYFMKQFKKVTGMTPTAYRQKNK